MTNQQTIDDLVIVRNNIDKDDLEYLNQICPLIPKSEWNGELDYSQTEPGSEWEKLKPLSDDDPDNFWSGRWISYDGLWVINPDVSKLTYKLLNKIKNQVECIYKEQTGKDKQLYTEMFQLARWPVGYSLVPHSDKDDHSPHRDYGILTYLNDNYEGGEIYFPALDLVIKPESGMTIIIPGERCVCLNGCKCKYRHGVKEIKKGIRYNYNSFWTVDKLFEYSHMMDFPSWKYQVYRNYKLAHKWDEASKSYIPKIDKQVEDARKELLEVVNITNKYGRITDDNYEKED